MTRHHKLRGLTQNKHRLTFWRTEVCSGCCRAKIKAWKGCVPFWRARGECSPSVSASRRCPLSLARGPFHRQSQHWPVGSFSAFHHSDAPSCLSLPSFKDSGGCMGPPESPGKSSHLKGSWLATSFPSVTLIPACQRS